MYNKADLSREKLALASVINVEESAYRRIGARMLVSSNGTWTGGISGGCLEGDALKRSQLAIYSNSPSRVVYDTMDDDTNEIGVGLGCNGRIEVLFTPIDPDDVDNPIQQLKKIVARNEEAILLKVIQSSSTDLLGSSTAIWQNDPLDFCALDDDLLFDEIEKTRITRRPQIIQLVNNEKQSLEILVEYIRPETRLVIIGDNYDVLALAGLVKEMGWEIHIVGSKKKISKALFAKAKEIYSYESIDQIPLDDFTAVVIMTHDYQWDKKILPGLLEKAPPYLGMLGPKKRMYKMQEELGISHLDQISYFHSPVGLDIGAESPEEIALSIIAEIVATFRVRNGRSLKFRKGTIHQRNEV